MKTFLSDRLSCNGLWLGKILWHFFVWLWLMWLLPMVPLQSAQPMASSSPSKSLGIAAQLEVMKPLFGTTPPSHRLWLLTDCFPAQQEKIWQANGGMQFDYGLRLPMCFTPAEVPQKLFITTQALQTSNDEEKKYDHIEGNVLTKEQVTKSIDWLTLLLRDLLQGKKIQGSQRLLPFKSSSTTWESVSYVGHRQQRIMYGFSAYVLYGIAVQYTHKVKQRGNPHVRQGKFYAFFFPPVDKTLAAFQGFVLKHDSRLKSGMDQYSLLRMHWTVRLMVYLDAEKAPLFYKESPPCAATKEFSLCLYRDCPREISILSIEVSILNFPVHGEEESPVYGGQAFLLPQFDMLPARKKGNFVRRQLLLIYGYLRHYTLLTHELAPLLFAFSFSYYDLFISHLRLTPYGKEVYPLLPGLQQVFKDPTCLWSACYHHRSDPPLCFVKKKDFLESIVAVPLTVTHSMINLHLFKHLKKIYFLSPLQRSKRHLL